MVCSAMQNTSKWGWSFIITLKELVVESFAGGSKAFLIDEQDGADSKKTLNQSQ